MHNVKCMEVHINCGYIRVWHFKGLNSVVLCRQISRNLHEVLLGHTVYCSKKYAMWKIVLGALKYAR